MKLVLAVLSLCLVMSPAVATAQTAAAPATAPKITPRQQELLDLSHAKWRWMAERNVEALADLFHAESVFVHMSGASFRDQELDVIRTGRIQYKHAEIFEESARLAGTTAIVVSRIRLDAVVGGAEVTNPFTVTEVYVQETGRWKLAVLAFSSRRTP